MAGPGYRVDVRELEDFSPAELYTLLKMRVDVFIVEQRCIYPELDGEDPRRLHLRLLAGDELLGTTRIGKPAQPGDPAIVGRVLVSPAHRGRRLGETLMKETIQACERLFPGHPIELSAQSHLLKFYQSFGFSAVSDEYLEEGVPHIDMARPATARAA